MRYPQIKYYSAQEFHVFLVNDEKSIPFNQNKFSARVNLRPYPKIQPFIEFIIWFKTAKMLEKIHGWLGLSHV